MLLNSNQTVENNIQKSADFFTSKTKDKIIDVWLGMFKEIADIRIPASLASMKGTIITPAIAFLNPTNIGLYRTAYDKQIRDVGFSTSRLRSLYQELQNYYKKLPARAPAAISADIRNEKKELRTKMADLNIDYIGVVKEKELDKFSCYNVFEFQNQMVNQSIVNILSLPEPEN